MKYNNNTSDFIADSMSKILSSESHKSIFNKKASADYNLALDEEDKSDECEEEKELEECSEDCEKECCDEDEAHDSKSVSEELKEMGEQVREVPLPSLDADEAKKAAAMNVAIDSLLSASAALDTLGFEKGASLSLKLAEFVVTAKKGSKKDDKKEDKKDKKSSKKEEKKEDKKPAKSKKDDKKEDKKEDKKPAKGKKCDEKEDKKDAKKSK